MGPKKKRARPSCTGQPSCELEALSRQVELLAVAVGLDNSTERAPKASALRALSRLRQELLRRQLDGAACASGAVDDPAVLQLLQSHALPQSLAKLLQSSKAEPALQQVVLEVVGIAALSSVAASETLASCGALLHALVEAMYGASSSSCRVVLAVLSAATTIATASLGCKELLHCGAVPALLWVSSGPAASCSSRSYQCQAAASASLAINNLVSQDCPLIAFDSCGGLGTRTVAAWAGCSSGQPPLELQRLTPGGEPELCNTISDASPRTSDKGVSTTSAPPAKATITGAMKTRSRVGGKRALVVEAAADALQLLLYSAEAEEATMEAVANAPDKASRLALVAFQEQLWSYFPLAALSGSRLQRTVQSLAKVVAYLALLCPVSQPQLDHAPDLLTSGSEDMGTLMVIGKPPPFLHGGERSLGAQLADVLKCEEAAAEDFLRCHWEQAPLLLFREERTASSRATRSCGGQISKLHQVLGLQCAEDVIELVSLGVHCPAFRADEMDALVALREAAAELGLPMLHKQDLNLVACGKEAPGNDGNGGPAQGIAGEECARALALGYTLALRGLQFRSHNVSTVAAALAAAMGQAAVGANLYLTPEGSQGLEAHYDDHCVFVCQLAGQKQWKVFPPQVQLPRLYSVRSRSQVDNVHPCIFNLQPGDALYIPRGWPHEALNVATKGDCNSREPSLHITFGVEVESPFEWEGLLHIALHLRCQELARDHHQSDEVLSTGKLGVGILPSDQGLHGATERGHSFCGDLHGHDPIIVLEGLLHVAVRAVGNRHEQLRRACLTSATAAGNDAARLEAYFCSVLKLVVSEASFEEACDIVLAFLIAEAMAASGTASEANAGSTADLGWMTWLTHIPGSSAAIGKPGAWLGHPAALLGCPATLFAGLTAQGWRASDEAAALRQKFVAAIQDLAMVGAANLRQVLAVCAALLAAYRDTRARLGNALASLQRPSVGSRSAAH
eukprot:SM000001S04768  [mRNA]  locus=s1:2084660:2088644:+ [translate_table: standard]